MVGLFDQEVANEAKVLIAEHGPVAPSSVKARPPTPRPSRNRLAETRLDLGMAVRLARAGA